MEDVFAVLTAVGVAFGPLAIACTKLVDMTRNLVDVDDNWPKWSWNVEAFVIGVVICVLFQLNVLEPIVQMIPRLAGTDVSGIVGQVITGLGVAGFAAYWHERMDLASSKASALNDETGPPPQSH